MRRILRFIALLLLASFGGVEGMRLIATPAPQVCHCGCASGSVCHCGCGGFSGTTVPARPSAPTQPAAPTGQSSPCPMPPGSCLPGRDAGTTPVLERAEAFGQVPQTRAEARPFPARMAVDLTALRVVRLLPALHEWLDGPPLLSGLDRLALLSVFRN